MQNFERYIGRLAVFGCMESDCVCLHGLIKTVLTVAPGIRFVRDATRGGLAGQI